MKNTIHITTIKSAMINNNQAIESVFRASKKSNHQSSLIKSIRDMKYKRILLLKHY